MGNTWEVWAYLPQASGGYNYERVWGGESSIRCVLAARKAKRIAGCVKVMWR